MKGEGSEAGDCPRSKKHTKQQRGRQGDRQAGWQAGRHADRQALGRAGLNADWSISLGHLLFLETDVGRSALCRLKSSLESRLPRSRAVPQLLARQVDKDDAISGLVTGCG